MKTETKPAPKKAAATQPICGVQSYLFFNGRCEEALEFYKTALGAEVTTLMRFKDSPEPASCGTAPADKIMHASFRIGSTEMMVSDGRCEGKPNFEGFALSIAVRDEAESKCRFDALAKDGKVVMPIGKTFFSPSFGMVTDRFGVLWMIIVPQQ